MDRPRLGTVPSSGEHLLDIAIINGYRQLAARVVYEAVLDLKSNIDPARKIMSAYDFLVSPWGLFLAGAGADIQPDVMLAIAEGWRADNRRLWVHGSDALGAELELQDQAEENLEAELYMAWTKTKAEAQRYRKMKQERKALTMAGNLL